MASEITDNGFKRVRYPELRAEIAQNWNEAITGLSTDPRTVAGRIVSQQADLIDDLTGTLQMILKSFSPYDAQGAQLSRLAPLMNRRRLDAWFGTVILTVTADANGCRIPAGSLVSNPNNGEAKVKTTRDVVVPPNGSAKVPAETLTQNSVEMPAGSMTKIETQVYGWASVTNELAGSVGRPREIDGSLRMRMLSTSAATNGTTEGIYTAISSLDGVTYCVVLDNRKDETNALGMPPHSVLAIVEGGDPQEIGLMYGVRSTAGGVDLTEPKHIPDATFESVQVVNPANRQKETVSFIRPSNKEVKVKVVANTYDDFPLDGKDLIKSALIEFVNGWDMGKTLFASRLYTPINNAVNVDIDSVTIDNADRSEPLVYQRIHLTPENIELEITENV
ncbi:baseplate J-like protein [Yersinia phage vB_YenM_636]|nr:baseplate J-like protein [Yersinia phage vB_YenM_636]